MPGESYQGSDLELFERIETVVQSAQLSERAWTGLWATLSNVSERARRPYALLLPVVDELPALAFLLHQDFLRDRRRLARAVGMILVIISARLRFLTTARFGT